METGIKDEKAGQEEEGEKNCAAWKSVQMIYTSWQVYPIWKQRSLVEKILRCEHHSKMTSSSQMITTAIKYRKIHSRLDRYSRFRQDRRGESIMKNYTIAVAGTGYVGLSIATLLS